MKAPTTNQGELIMLSTLRSLAPRHGAATARRCAAIATLAACVGASHADTVDVIGGFTLYVGALEQPSALRDFQTTFEAGGRTIVASPTGPFTGLESVFNRYGIGQGQAVLTTGHVGETVPSVDFYFDSASNPQVRNRIAFTPTVGADVNVGDTFKLGTFSFQNGAWLGDFPDGTFEYRIRTASSNPALDGHSFVGYIDFHVTSGLSADGQIASTDPVANADYFYFRPDPFNPGSVPVGFVGVYEAESILQPPGGSNTGTIDLYGRIGSLIPEYFANPQGVTLQASLPVVPNAPVPEPSTWALLLLGLAASAAEGKRRQAVRSRRPVA
jgi:PEP-CTERM motif